MNELLDKMISEGYSEKAILHFKESSLYKLLS